ncbi:MerR family transcriptional regulator [Streptosporangium canum]|uniref:MerR family transcriptional regulator n=1 Tax=Streptosporangium canum TaxID=324952 RepID=UPI0034494972
MDNEDLMLAGAFGAASRLSPKALRLYAEQRLLVPASTDLVTGYRYYQRDQVARARLIARLRSLNLPLARIAVLLDLPAESRQAELLAWLDAQEADLRHRRELVETLSDGDKPAFGEVRTRQVVEHKFLYREQRLHVDALDDFAAESQARIRTWLNDAGLPGDGPMQVHFHGLVTRDSDGPVEVGIAFAGSVEPVDDLRIRLVPVHLEAYLPVPKAYSVFPHVLRVYDALEAWIDANKFLCTASPVEIHPGTGGADFDVAYPVVSQKG